MTEPQKQDIVDKIIENTNVPVKPKPMVSNIITSFLNYVILPNSRVRELRNYFWSISNNYYVIHF